MTMSKTGPISAGGIKDFARRVNVLLDEKQTLVDDVREVYDEAKRAGVNATALRKVIAKRRAKTPDPTIAAAMEAYEHALDEAASMVSNGSTSLRAAAKESGFSKSAIQRQVSHRNENANGETEITPPSSGGEGKELEVPSGRDAPSDDISSTGFEAGNQAHEGEDDANDWRGDDGNESGSGKNPRTTSGRAADDGDGNPVGNNGRHEAPADRPAGRDGGAAGPVCAVATIDQWREGSDAPRAAAGLPRGAALHGELNGRPAEPAGRDLEAAERSAVAVGRGVDAPSTPPLGAVGSPEGDRVARPTLSVMETVEIDLTIPPHLDRRTEARRAGT